jgi:hypothetical protein
MVGTLVFTRVLTNGNSIEENSLIAISCVACKEFTGEILSIWTMYLNPIEGRKVRFGHSILSEEEYKKRSGDPADRIRRFVQWLDEVHEKFGPEVNFANYDEDVVKWLDYYIEKFTSNRKFRHLKTDYTWYADHSGTHYNFDLTRMYAGAALLLTGKYSPSIINALESLGLHELVNWNELEEHMKTIATTHFEFLKRCKDGQFIPNITNTLKRNREDEMRAHEKELRDVKKKTKELTATFTCDLELLFDTLSKK